MPDFSKLFEFSYLLHPNPGRFFPFAPWILGFFALLIATSIIIFIALRVAKPNPVLKRILRKMPTRLFAFGMAGLVLVLLRLGEAAYLSMRAWLVVWGAFFIWYVADIVLRFQRYPKDLEEFNRHLATRNERQQKWERFGKKKKRR